MNSFRIYIFFSLLVLSVSANAQTVDQILSALEKPLEKADTLYSLARKMMLQSKTDSALKLIQKGLPYAKNAGGNDYVARYYSLKANIEFVANKFEQTLQTLREGKAYVSEQTPYTTYSLFNMLAALSHRRMSKNDSAIVYYRKAEALNNIHNPYKNFLVYSELGLMYDQADAYKEAEFYYEKAYALTTEKAIRFDHGLVLPQIAMFYARHNNAARYATLLKEHQEFMKGTKKDVLKDPEHNYLLNDFGTIVFTKRTAFMKEVAEELEKRENGNGALIAYSQLSVMYEKKNMYAEAILYMKKSLEMAEQVKDIPNQYLNTRSLFRLSKYAGNHADATAYADRVLELKDSMIRLQQRDLVMNLETKYQTEQKQKEIELLSTQKAITEKQNEILNFQNQLRNKEIFLLNAGKKVAALQLQKEEEKRAALARENELMDSILFSEKAYNNILTSEKEKETALNASLSRENQLKVSELKKEKSIRWMTMTGAALLLLSGLVIFSMYQKQKKKNAIIQKQAADLEMIMQEIHHRVKNNLQIVSSLLDLQSHGMTDLQAAEAVKEGKNRVQSMALIHQNLYSEGNIKGIEVKGYISNLLQSLCDSYNISSDKIKINTNIDNLSLDIDTMIPIGLVINELVSNVFKYAFREKANGELNLVLQQANNRLHLQVSDNGIGFPQGLDTKSSKSFGLKLIRAFAQKLKAQLNIYNNNGAVVEMHISKYKLV